MVSLLTLVIAGIISMLQLIFEKYAEKLAKHKDELLGFSSGLFITIIFMHLMPSTFKENNEFALYAFALGGYAVYHLLEKYAYTRKNETTKDIGLLHASAFFIDGLVIGLNLALFLPQNPKNYLTLLIALPFAVHAIASAITLKELGLHFKSSIAKIALALSIFIGTLASTIAGNAQLSILQSFFIGAMLYVVTRDAVPKGKGKPLAFVAGMMIGIAIIILSSQ